MEGSTFQRGSNGKSASLPWATSTTVTLNHWLCGLGRRKLLNFLVWYPLISFGYIILVFYSVADPHFVEDSVFFALCLDVFFSLRLADSPLP